MITEFLLLGPYVPDKVSALLASDGTTFPYNRYGSIVTKIKNILISIPEAEIASMALANSNGLYTRISDCDKGVIEIVGTCSKNPSGLAVCFLQRIDSCKKWVFREVDGVEIIDPVPTKLISSSLNLYSST